MSGPGPVRTTPRPSLPGPQGFVWATGIEDTFIAEPHPVTGRTLDEYALTDHYSRWDEDLGLAADLGVRAIRYGLPWYRLNPERGRFDWSWSDRVLERLVNAHRLEPIVDLVHYGTPRWLDGAALNPDYPARVAEWGAAVAERYRGLCDWYTPLNEPRIHAWYAGRLGWWPPHARGWNGFARVLLQLCRGICLTQRAIAGVQPSARFVHVDATDLYEAQDPADATLAAEAEFRQQLVFLALDLVTGRVDGSHPLADWLREQGFADADAAWFREHAVTPDVVGVNMYPMYSRKEVRRDGADVRVRIRACWAETLAALLRLYAGRYSPLPIMITETASSGTVRRRTRWIEDSVAVVREVRAAGLPIEGYCWWPLYSLVGWAYQRSDRPLARYLIDMGLYDLETGPHGLRRVRTPAVEAFQRVIAANGHSPQG